MPVNITTKAHTRQLIDRANKIQTELNSNKNLLNANFPI